MDYSEIPSELHAIVEEFVDIAPGEEGSRTNNVYYRRIKNAAINYSKNGGKNIADFLYEALKILAEPDLEFNNFHEKVIKIFNKHVTDPNQCNSAGNTFLTKLTILSKFIHPSVHEAFARNAIEHGADINLLDERENTPLTTSLKCTPPKHKPSLTKILLSLGADPDQENKYGELPLNLAIAQKYKFKGDISPHLDLLSYGANPNKLGTGRKVTPQVLACSTTAQEEEICQVMQDLLEYGVNTTCKESSLETHQSTRITSLYMCANKNLKDVAELLLNAGAYQIIDLAPEKDGIPYRNPLELSILRGNTEMAELLLNHGANVTDNNRLFIDAIEHGRVGELKMLMLHDINSRHRDRPENILLRCPVLPENYEEVLRMALSFDREPIDPLLSGTYMH